VAHFQGAIAETMGDQSEPHAVHVDIGKAAGRVVATGLVTYANPYHAHLSSENRHPLKRINLSPERDPELVKPAPILSFHI
jgi:hypothetical protein